MNFESKITKEIGVINNKKNMIEIIKFIQKYSTRLKYWLLIVSIFSMIFAIRSYLNNIAILDAIQWVEIEKNSKLDEINFTQNFLIKYLWSEYGSYFLAHENSILYKDEYILRLDMKIKQDDLTSTDPDSSQNTWIQSNSKQTRNNFIKDKLKQIR